MFKLVEANFGKSTKILGNLHTKKNKKMQITKDNTMQN